MAEERIPSSVGDENQELEKKELATDRKSLTGMSEKVSATLAPLLGGIKHHPEVEVDLGRESGAATYETVPIGSTPMSRYGAVPEATADPNPSLHAPFQDVGLVHSSNVISESGRSRPGHKPNEDQFVLDGNSDPVHQFRSTTPTSEAEKIQEYHAWMKS